MIHRRGGVSETQLPFILDGNQVQVGMGNFETGNDHSDPLGRELSHLRFSHFLGHPHQVSVQVWIEVDPVRNLLHRNNQGMSWSNRVDGEKDNNSLVTVDEMTGQVARDNLRKHGTHKSHFERKGKSLLA